MTVDVTGLGRAEAIAREILEHVEAIRELQIKAAPLLYGSPACEVRVDLEDGSKAD